MLIAVVAQAQNPQAVRFPKGLRVDSVFSNTNPALAFTVGDGARLRLYASDSAGNLPPLRFMTTNKLTKNPQTFALEPHGDSLYFTGESGIRRALSVAIPETTGTSAAGGWTLTDKIYSDYGKLVHVRGAAADTGGTKLLNVYGTTYLGNTVTVGGNILLSGFYLSNDGGNEGISVDNSGNVTLSGTTNTVGTITTGVWKGTAVDTTYLGGTKYHNQPQWTVTGLPDSIAAKPTRTEETTRFNLKVNYSDTTSAIAMRWQLGGYYARGDTSSVLASKSFLTNQYAPKLGSSSIVTVGTLSAGSIPSSLITGLGTMSTQNASAVSITGGSITVPTLKVDDGTGKLATLAFAGGSNKTYTFDGTAGTVWTTGNDGAGSGLYADSTAVADWAKVTNKPTFGTMSTQNASAVSITGGSISVPTLKIDDGAGKLATLAFTGGSNKTYTFDGTAGTIWTTGNDGAGSGLYADSTAVADWAKVTNKPTGTYLTSAFGATANPDGSGEAQYLVDSTPEILTRVYKRAITINGVTVNVLVTD